MKQVLQSMRNGETMVADVPTPTVKSGSALVQTAASLVSAGTERMVVEFAEKNLVGKAQARPDLVAQVMDKVRREGLLTTLDATFNRLDQPMALGYSSAGTIVELGAGVTGFRPGDRVACAGGGYAVHAEYGVIPHNLMAHIPDQVDFDSAAFATIGAVSMHGFRLSQVQLGERVAVIGLGLLGLLAVQICQAAGCEVLGIDVDTARVQLAKQLGAQAVERTQAEEAAQAFSLNRGVDAVIICADTSSNDPVTLAGNIARDRAKVVAIGAVGLDIPRKTYYAKELDLIVSRSYGPGRYDTYYEEKGIDYPIGYVRWTEGRNLEAFLDLLASGKLDIRPLITHRFSIEQAPQAYELITGKKKEPFLGVLLTYPPREAGQAEIDKRIPIHKAITASAMPEKMPALGVLGAGNFASAVFLPTVHQVGGVVPIGIASATGLSARLASQRFGYGYSTSSEDFILQDPSINTLAILTRHNLHARQILAGFKAGKHVYCEKPLAINQEQLDELAAALNEDSSHLLTIGFNRRFSAMGQQLKAFFAKRSEPLQIAYRVNAGFLPPEHWLHDPQVGGGRIIGEGCHFIDFITFLVGALPVSVTAQALPDGERYHQDNVLITLTYPDGSIGTVTYLANGDRSAGKERVEVFGAGRIGILDDYRTLELFHGGKRQVVHSRLRQDKGHHACWASFVKAITLGGLPPISYAELFSTTQATITAMEQIRSTAIPGEAVVLNPPTIQDQPLTPSNSESEPVIPPQAEAESAAPLAAETDSLAPAQDGPEAA